MTLLKLTPEYWVKHASTKYPTTRGRTDWFPGTEAPLYPGYYERHYTDGIYKHYWDGARWYHHKNSTDPNWRQVGDYAAWRGITLEYKTELEQIAIKHQAQELIDFCETAGHVVTISLQPRQPLAMGNYEMVVDVRQQRGAQ